MNPRLVAYQTLLHATQKNLHPDAILRVTLSRSGLNPSDKALATELVYGVLRWQGLIDWHIGNLSRIPIERIELPVKVLLRLGIYQIVFLDRVPNYAAVNEVVKIARATQPKHIVSFVNAILRNASKIHPNWKLPNPEKEKLKYLAIKTAHPQWFIEKLLKTMSFEEVEAICNANNLLPPLVVRVSKGSREEVMERFEKLHCSVSPTFYSPLGLAIRGLRADISEFDLYKEGFVQVQDEASQLVPYLVAPKKGERILDLCCGFGVKSTQIGALMENEGFVLAVDISSWKLEALRENAKRLEVSIIETLCEDVMALEPAKIGLFDKVLLDAPCTGWGTIRRNPDIKWKTHPRDPWRMSRTQEALLEKASSFVKPGGTLTYATCTIFDDENEKVVQKFQEKFGWEIVPAYHIFREVFGDYAERLRDLTDGSYFRTVTYKHNIDGFFGVTFKKPAS